MCKTGLIIQKLRVALAKAQMDNTRPQKINLTDEEKAILSQINFKPKDTVGSVEKSLLELAARAFDELNR